MRGRAGGCGFAWRKAMRMGRARALIRPALAGHLLPRGEKGRHLVGYLLLALLAPTLAAAATVNVIPRPLTVEAVQGAAVTIGDGAAIVAPPDDAEARAVGDYLKALMLRSRGLRLKSRASAAGPAIRLERGPVGDAPGAYALEVSGRDVTIRAPTRAGLFYGAVTLWQLMTAPGERPRGPVALSPLRIVDQPRYPWRGLLLDSARHYQSFGFIERMIDWMALHKLDILEWHLTDDQAWRLEIRQYPRLTRVGGWRPDGAGGFYGGIYTQEQVRALVAYAADRNVTIVPEIEMPGHALAAIVAYPELGLSGGVTPAALNDWGTFPSVFNVDDHTFAFLQNVLGEVTSLFPSPWIAVGGDEAVKDAWRDSPEVQARMKALGVADEAALQSWFTRRIGTWLNAHGRRLVGWDEILQGGDLPTNDVVMSWHGVDGAVAAAASGHDVVLATSPTLYFDNRQSARADGPPGRGRVVSLADVYAFDPGDPPVPPPPSPAAPTTPPPSSPTAVGALPPFVFPPTTLATPRLYLTADEKRHILGVQANIWTEHVRTEERLEAMAFPRAAAVAESGWTAEGNRDWASFVARLPAQLARYRSLGLKADESALAVDMETQPSPSEGGLRVSLSNPARAGQIRYTTDGAAPSLASPIYQAPLDLGLGTRLQAATFLGAERISPVVDARLDIAAARLRTSQQMKLCTDKVSLNLEGGGPGVAKRPIFLADIMNPCWIFPAADLGGIGAVTVGVSALRFNFQLGAEVKKIALRPPQTPEGELVVRLDGCDGELLAVLPLARAAASPGVDALTAAIPPHEGRRDLCFQFTARRIDPMWALAWARLDAGSLAVAAER